MWRAFGDDTKLAKILSLNKPIKAPEKLKQEILGFKGTIMKDFGISSIRFDTLWEILCAKIMFEGLDAIEIERAAKIVAELELDLDDAEYIAVCLKYAPQKKVTFWTYEQDFVYGDKAQRLRQLYNIHGNFDIS